MKLFFLLVPIFLSLSVLAEDASSLEALSDKEFDSLKRSLLVEECKNNNNFLKQKFNVLCEENYHHYNSSAYESYTKTNAMSFGKVRISEFNSLHPGMGKTRFKDYKKVAQMMNRFDIIGITELIPLMAEDLKNNKAVVQFAKDAPQEIIDTKAEIKQLKKDIRKKPSVIKSRKLVLLTSKLKRLQKDFKKINSVYRAPGYLKILEQLHKLKNGKDWALLLAPRGEGAKTSHTLELVGYYYRTTVVKPTINPYCEETRDNDAAKPYACIINMDENDLGSDKQHVFSRRPFMASFMSGNFSFTLISSHIIFDSPKDQTLMPIYMQAAFNTNSYEDFGSRSGITKNNYARFVETKITLDFIKTYTEKYPFADVIYMGDFNIERKNKFVDTLLQAWPESEMFITEATSTSIRRVDSDDNKTNGVSSNYDHFIFNPNTTNECVNDDGEIKGGAFNFQKSRFGSYINRVYRVRAGKPDELGVYQMNTEKYQSLMKKYVEPKASLSDPFYTIGNVKHVYEDTTHSITTRGIIKSKKESVDYAKFFKERILDSQLKDDSFYYFYMQLISDHLPIYMECRTN